MAPQVRARQAFAGRTPSAESKIAADAYIFGYPLVLMDATRRLMTAVTKPNGSRAPINQFVHKRTFPDASFTDVVRPNADTLYSLAWLDLSAEPIVLSVPPMGDRYYVMQLLDAWSNVFASPGTRTTGSAKRDFAIVGPWWSGTLPRDVKEIRSPTNIVWVIGRTETDGKADFPAVHAIQNQYTLTKLGAWGGARAAAEDAPVDSTVDSKTSPVEHVARMTAGSFFDRLNVLMANNPPHHEDGPALLEFASIGVAPGRTFVDDAPDSPIAAGVAAARDRLIAAAGRPQGDRLNGWDMSPRAMGRYGTDYASRAVAALLGLGANLREDAMYQRATRDADGQPLNGTNKYFVRFAKGALPPVRAFWSITLYNPQQRFVANVLDRYAIGDRDNLTFGNDGSLVLHIQHESPGIAHSSNWLPAPAGPFNLMMRLYWPSRAILDGVWKPPVIERVCEGDPSDVGPSLQL